MQKSEQKITLIKIEDDRLSKEVEAFIVSLRQNWCRINLDEEILRQSARHALAEKDYNYIYLLRKNLEAKMKENAKKKHDFKTEASLKDYVHSTDEYRDFRKGLIEAKYEMEREYRNLMYLINVKNTSNQDNINYNVERKATGYGVGN